MRGDMGWGRRDVLGTCVAGGGPVGWPGQIFLEILLEIRHSVRVSLSRNFRGNKAFWKEIRVAKQAFWARSLEKNGSRALGPYQLNSPVTADQ